jgi:hypothetical protein
MKLSTFLSILILIVFAACNDPQPEKGTTSAGDVDVLIKQLTFDGTLESGAPPNPNAKPSALRIAKGPSGASTTYDNLMFIPLSISDSIGFDGVYIQLSNESDEFSGSYMKIPLTKTSSTDTVKMLKFAIPADIDPGLFFMNMSTYNGDTVSAVHSFPVKIVHPQRGCDGGGKNALSGDFQFCARSYSFDESDFPRNNFNEIEPQRLTLKANLFESADRVDVYVDKHWVGGTGTILAFGDAPVPTACDDEDASANGFVRNVHYLSFEVMPDQRIDVFVNGCLDVTAWEYSFTCP